MVAGKAMKCLFTTALLKDITHSASGGAKSINDAELFREMIVHAEKEASITFFRHEKIIHKGVSMFG